ncbi:MAG: hypothetical protein IKB13_02770 [Clostridia bacterium]|nr:hypothetical protein [Clostridia bacterium]
MNKTDGIPPKTERSIVAQYVREVNKEIIATPKQKRKLFGDLRSDIHERIADGKIASYEDVIAHFGTPEQVAKDFFATANIKEIKKRLMIRRIVVSAVAFCVLFLCAFYTFLLFDGFSSVYNYTVESFEVDGEVLYEDMCIEDNRLDASEQLSHVEK